jgi:hypothetical protein
VDKKTEESTDIIADKDKFDALLRRMIATKPLPLKDVIGTSPYKKKPKN